MDGHAHLASWIRANRIKRGWTQRELGRRVGAVHMTVSRWETCLNVPSLAQFRALCLVFGSSADRALGLVSRDSAA
jgi:transcriptional regulator with XRE-family HTH domain